MRLPQTLTTWNTLQVLYIKKRSKHEEAPLNYVLQTQQVSSVNKMINFQLLLDQEIADCILEDTPMPEYIMCQNNSAFLPGI